MPTTREPSLDQERQRIHAILDTSVDGCFEVRTDGVFVYVNPAFASFVERCHSELVGGNLEQLVEDALDERFIELVRICASDPAIARPVAFKLRKSRGEWAYFEGSASGLVDEGGEVAGLRAIVRPISVETAPSAAKHEPVQSPFSDELQRLTGQLVEARNQVVAAMRVKAEFIDNLSHELRAPVNTITGMADLLYEADAASERREYVDAIKESSETLLDLLDKVLDFSGIQIERLKLDEVEFGFREFLAGTLRPLAARAFEQGIDFRHEVAADIEDRVIGSPKRLRQVLINLVENAIRHTETGSVLVRVELDAAKDHLRTLRFEVVDTGCGIETDEQVRLFDLLQQAEPNLDGGLGLPIASQLVRMMGGRTWIESRTGHGTRVFFTTNLLATNRIEEVTGSVAKLAGCRILLVDPSASGRRSLQAALAQVEADVRAEGAVDSAWQALREHLDRGVPYEAVILDASLAGAVELARRLRADEELATIPIVTVGRYGHEDPTLPEQRSLATAWIERPFATTALVYQLGRLFADRQTYRAQTSWSRCRILVADDNPINQRMTRAVLESQGHRVEVAADGQQAVERLKAEAFDLVLMDLWMPRLDGLQATRAIREGEADGTFTPILALTGDDGGDEKRQALEAGMNGCLAKPVQLAELVDALERLDGNGEVGSSDDEPAVNRVALLEHTGGDCELIAELLDLYRNEDAIFSDALVAIGERDAARLGEAAHKLTGTFASLAAEGAMQLAMDLKARADAHDFDEADEIMIRMREVSERIVNELGEMIR